MTAAVITGASAGLGAEFTRQLVREFPEIEEFWLIARRVGKLEELAMYAPQGTTSITALVARDRQLLRLTLPLPQASAPLSNYKLRVQDEAAVNRWLSA